MIGLRHANWTAWSIGSLWLHMLEVLCSNVDRYCGLYIFHNGVTPCSRFLFANITVSHLVDKFPTVHHRVHKSSSPVRISTRMSVAHDHLFQIHFNIIIPRIGMSSMWAISFRFAHQNSVGISPVLRKLNNFVFLCSIRVFPKAQLNKTSRRMGWAGYVARIWQNIDTSWTLMRKPEGNRLAGRLRRRC